MAFIDQLVGVQLSSLALLYLLVGFVFSLTGWLLATYPPERPNPMYGYRTPASMRNQQTWDAANQYSARHMLNLGLIFFALGLGMVFLPWAFLDGPWAMGGGLVTVVLGALTMIAGTERYLLHRFDRDGKPREDF